MGVGKRIGEICKQRGISLRQLAADAEIPYTTLYSSVKRDSDSIDPETLKRIAKALKVNPIDLFFFDDLLDNFLDVTIREIGEQQQLEIGKKRIEMFISAANLAGFSIVFRNDPENVIIRRKDSGEIIAQNVSNETLVDAIFSLIGYAGFLCAKMADVNKTQDE